MSSYDEHLISQAGGDGDPLDAIQRRADKATPGPWEIVMGSLHPPIIYANRSGLDIALMDDRDSNDADAEFIANAPADIAYLTALVRSQHSALTAVLTLANSSGRCGWRISADELRKTLRGES